MPPIHLGGAHTLRVALNGADLIVIADGQEAWVGGTGSRLDDIAGPAGFRSDNVRFEAEFFAVIPKPVALSQADKNGKRCYSPATT